jgi:hypothetical protein
LSKRIPAMVAMVLRANDRPNEGLSRDPRRFEEGVGSN